MLTSGYSGTSDGKKVIRPLGPEKESKGVDHIGIYIAMDGNTTIVKGVGRVTEPGYVTALSVALKDVVDKATGDT